MNVYRDEDNVLEITPENLTLTDDFTCVASIEQVNEEVIVRSEIDYENNKIVIEISTEDIENLKDSIGILTIELYKKDKFYKNIYESLTFLNKNKQVVYRNRENRITLILELNDEVGEVDEVKVILKQDYTIKQLNYNYNNVTNELTFLIEPLDLIYFNTSFASLKVVVTDVNGTTIKSNLLPVMILPREYNSDFTIKYKE